MAEKKKMVLMSGEKLEKTGPGALQNEEVQVSVVYQVRKKKDGYIV